MTDFTSNPAPAEFGTALPGLVVARVDPTSDDPRQRELWRAHWDCANASDRRSQAELAAGWDPESQRTNRANARNAYWAYVPLLDGVPVGHGWVFCNRDDAVPAGVFVDIEPEFRGRGIGSAVLPVLESEALGFGRADLETVVDVPGGLPDAQAPGLTFARAAGYREYQRHRVQALALPLADDFAAARPTPGYRVETCEGVPPQEWWTDLARLNERMATDAPHGDAPAVETTWDEERVRREYERYVELGEPVVTGVAIHEETGRLVAYSVSSWIPSAPDSIRQEDTLVLREHRGHGLGRATKTAAIARIVPLCPGAKLQRTSNAAENAPMLRVNEELGYRHGYDTAVFTKPVPSQSQVPTEGAGQ